MWKKYIQTLPPAPSYHPSLLGMHLQKVWAEMTTSSCQRGRHGHLSSLLHSMHAFSFALALRCSWHLSAWICLTKLAKKQYWKKGGGANFVLTWCAFTHKSSMCWLGSRRYQMSARAGPKERARLCVPKWWGESSIAAAGSRRLLKWLGSSHRTMFAGSMLPSSAAGEKCS